MKKKNIIIILALLILIGIGTAIVISQDTEQDKQSNPTATAPAQEGNFQVTWEKDADKRADGKPGYTPEDREEIVQLLKQELTGHAQEGREYVIVSAFQRGEWGSLGISERNLGEEAYLGVDPHNAILHQENGVWKLWIRSTEGYCEVFKETHPDTDETELGFVGCAE